MRFRFLSIHAVAWCIDVPETILKSDGGLRDLPHAYVLLIIPLLILSVIAVFWSNKTFHKFFAVFWPIFVVGYLSTTTLVQIAT